MFKFFKEKIVNWAKKISGEKSLEPTEEKQKEEKKITVPKPEREKGFFEKITGKIWSERNHVGCSSCDGASDRH